MTNSNLQSQITARCPCFAVPLSQCSCQVDNNYRQMIEAIQKANSWLVHAYQLMTAMGINAENTDSEWPTNLADAAHYCGEVIDFLEQFQSETEA